MKAGLFRRSLFPLLYPGIVGAEFEPSVPFGKGSIQIPYAPSRPLHCRRGPTVRTHLLHRCRAVPDASAGGQRLSSSG